MKLTAKELAKRLKAVEDTSGIWKDLPDEKDICPECGQPYPDQNFNKLCGDCKHLAIRHINGKCLDSKYNNEAGEDMPCECKKMF